MQQVPLEVVKPLPPEAIKAWGEASREQVRAETETQALIRDLQQRVHRMEQLLRAHGLMDRGKLQ